MVKIIPRPPAVLFRMLFITLPLLELDHSQMQVNVTIAVQKPDAVDVNIVAAELPRGRANVTVVEGGLNVHDPEAGTTSVIANAAIEACYDIPEGAWVLS